MNLTRNLYLLFLCGMCTPAVHAAGNMTTDAAVQQTVVPRKFVHILLHL